MPVLSEKYKIMKVTLINMIDIVQWMELTYPHRNAESYNYEEPFSKSFVIRQYRVTFEDHLEMLKENMSRGGDNFYFGCGVQTGRTFDWCLIDADIFDLYSKTEIAGREWGFEIVDNVFPESLNSLLER